MLAGVSIDYYTRMERGNLRGVSDSVLEALARACSSTRPSAPTCFDLARAAEPPCSPPPPAAPSACGRACSDPRRDDRRPALVQNGRLDVLAANPLGRALYSEMDLAPARPANHARFVFLDPRAGSFFLDWERVADDTVAMLRTEAGRDPHDRDLSDLVGELSTRSESSASAGPRTMSALHQTGAKRFHHPVVGDLDLTFEMLELAADPGLRCSPSAPSPAPRPRRAQPCSGSWAATRSTPPTRPERERTLGPPQGGLEDGARGSVRVDEQRANTRLAVRSAPSGELPERPARLDTQIGRRGVPPVAESHNALLSHALWEAPSIQVPAVPPTPERPDLGSPSWTLQVTCSMLPRESRESLCPTAASCCPS